jgi:predicted HD superfamily hydrolase involved in NAD metabolism
MSVPSYDTAREALRRRLGARALAHSDAVAEAAAHLAGVYGVDVPSARLAGLLHDWCKEADHGELVAAAGRLGVTVTDADLARPYLLHGPVGAAELAACFPGLPAEIVHAVRVHTFGDVEMVDLDRVVYIADMIEPKRGYRGIDELRRAVGDVSLAELMTLAYARSITHLVEKRKPLHPTTLAVWNRLVLTTSTKPEPAGKAGG